MKFLILALCVACAAAATIDHDAQILRFDNEQSPDGNFQYAFDIDNGISAQASGALKQINKDETVLVQSGSNQHTSPDGQTFQLTFIADENGFQPQGAHLPTPPPAEPIPEYIQRALEYIRSRPAYVEPKQI